MVGWESRTTFFLGTAWMCRSAQKIIFLTPNLIGVVVDFTRNCMKDADLHQNIMYFSCALFLSSTPPQGVGCLRDLIFCAELKISCNCFGNYISTTLHICRKKTEMYTCVYVCVQGLLGPYKAPSVQGSEAPLYLQTSLCIRAS